MESSSKSEDVRPILFDDFQRGEIPFRMSVRLPRTKTRGIAANLISAGANIQAKFSQKNSRSVTARSLP
jgi:hypothetical protein